MCRRGDVNNDGSVTGADVAPFVGVLLAGTGTPQQVCASDLGGPAADEADRHDARREAGVLAEAVRFELTGSSYGAGV